MIFLLAETESSSTSFFTNTANIPLMVALLSLLGTLVVSILTYSNNKKTRIDTKNTIKKNDIVEKKKKYETKLNEFYIPLRHYLENSKTLFKIFSKGKPDNFRTLTYLLKPLQMYGSTNKIVILDKNDKAILKKIFEIGEKIEELIYEKSYLIGDDADLVQNYNPRQGYTNIIYEKDMSLLSLLVCHITVIRMAFKEDLSGEADKFEGFVFPNEINIRVKEQIEKLEKLVSACDIEISKL